MLPECNAHLTAAKMDGQTPRTKGGIFRGGTRSELNELYNISGLRGCGRGTINVNRQGFSFRTPFS